MNIKDKTYIIAEMSLNHGGDYEKSIEIIFDKNEINYVCKVEEEKKYEQGLTI